MFHAPVGGSHNYCQLHLPLSALSIAVTLPAGGPCLQLIDGRTEQVSKGARALRPQWLAGTTYPRCAFNSIQANFLPGSLRSVSAAPRVQSSEMFADSFQMAVKSTSEVFKSLWCCACQYTVFQPCRECGHHQVGGTRIPFTGEGTQPSQSSAL